MVNWLSANSTAIALWAGALCTFGIYSVLYKENKFYRFFEHMFIGLYGGYGVYITWHNILYPKWWKPMTADGQWWWIFAAVVGSMFYFMYSRRHAWISRVIFGLFMGFAAGGIFREFYEGYFPQIGSSMKPFTGGYANVLSVLVFYVVLIAALSYFFFSFEHKHPVVRSTAVAGRWFLMIGFGAMFGATVMGRMTLFIGRLNFLINNWIPEVCTEARSPLFWVIVPLVVAMVGLVVFWAIRRPRKIES
ncbi:MAG: hypothetical protein GX141_12295 [Armatimonadetes bacterium]|nr:hypothetical protein [Armatimonadota bacterium]